MRRLSMPLLTALLLLTSTASAAHAEPLWRRFVSCFKFADTWCDLTREEADGPLEWQAIEAGCAYLYLRCSVAPDLR